MHNYYEEGLAKGYFVRTSDGSVWTGYSGSVLVDLGNPNAYQWMVDIIFQVTIGGSSYVSLLQPTYMLIILEMCSVSTDSERASPVIA